MKRNLLALAAVAALFSTPVFAAEYEGWVYNGLTGWSMVSEDNLDDSELGSDSSIGYRWGMFGVDVGYMYFSEFSDKVGNVKVDADPGGWTVGVNFNANISDNWSFQGRTGVFSWDANEHVAIGGVRVKRDDSSNDWYGTLSLDYNFGAPSGFFSKHSSIGLGYAYYHLGGDTNIDINVWGLHSEYRF